MKKNAGSIDRVLRVVVGIVLLAIAFVGPQTPWGYVGVVPLVTGLMGFCPLYTVLGMNTCPMKSTDKKES